jgi:hyperosmotically inducible protein
MSGLTVRPPGFFLCNPGKQRREMKARRLILSVFPLLVAGMLSGCSTNKSSDVTDNIRKSLDQAGFKDVSVSQDRDKGVVTLTGTVPTETDKQQAESIAKSNAPNLVVADQIAVRPPGNESEAKAVDSDLDKAIEKNLDATLIKHRLKKNVKYDVKNGVVTLKGDVPSQTKREQVEKLAASIPNVKQVVNEIEVKNPKATSTS